MSDYSLTNYGLDRATAAGGMNEPWLVGSGNDYLSSLGSYGSGGGGWSFGGMMNDFGKGMRDSGFLSSRQPGPDGNMMDVQGWGAPVLGTVQGLFNAYMGMKQYGLMKSQLAESKRQFGLNYDAQRQTTNAAIEDRQRARVASNPGAYQSVSDYMAQNAIRPNGG